MFSVISKTFSNCQKKILPIRAYSQTIMRILNVAEKNDAAKNISALLSNGVTQKVTLPIVLNQNPNYVPIFPARRIVRL